VTLLNGQSEIDTLDVRLPDYGRTIKNWSSYTLNAAFLTPTVGWSFRISEEDTTLVNELLVDGARVELAINDKIQCYGTIDWKEVTGDDSGTTVTIQGRDILGRAVDACMDPAYKFVAGVTITDLVLGLLRPFGITRIYSSDDLNIAVISGFRRGQGGSTQKVSVQVPQRTENDDGTVSLSYTTETGEVVHAPGDATRPDLTKIALEQAKPHIGEGVAAFIDRTLRRLGYAMWAAADGSGVVVDRPSFNGPTQGSIIRRRSDGGASNNAKRGGIRTNLASQPSCIVAFGFGGGRDAEKSKLRCIMINELTGLDAAGKPLPEVQNILARYKGARVLPIRSELVPIQRPIGDRLVAAPFFCKDDEAKNLEQLEGFVRREMANRQKQAVTGDYTMIGHTQDGHPWTVNSLVSVEDEVANFSGQMWVMEKSFAKSSSGTTTVLKLILPYALQIGA